MKTLLTLLLSISLSSIALAGNSVFIEQIGTSTDTTVNIDIGGNNHSVNLSMEGTGNELDFKQEGNNNTISWVSYGGLVKHGVVIWMVITTRLNLNSTIPQARTLIE